MDSFVVRLDNPAIDQESLDLWEKCTGNLSAWADFEDEEWQRIEIEKEKFSAEHEDEMYKKFRNSWGEMTNKVLNAQGQMTLNLGMLQRRNTKDEERESRINGMVKRAITEVHYRGNWGVTIY